MSVTDLARSRIPNLTARDELALLARCLFTEGYDDHATGHITCRQLDGTFLTLPFDLGWNEVCGRDILRIDPDGVVIEGDGEVSRAIMLHLVLHRLRPRVGVAIHQHPRYGTIYAAAHRVPEAYDQTSAFLAEDDIALYDDYEGGVVYEDNAIKNVKALGTRNMALLANHGVLVLGDDVRQAHHRAVALEWRCRQAWMVEAIGGGIAMPAKGQAALQRMIHDDYQERPPNLWEWSVRRELRASPEILLPSSESA